MVGYLLPGQLLRHAMPLSVNLAVQCIPVVLTPCCVSVTAGYTVNCSLPLLYLDIRIEFRYNNHSYYFLLD